ncbi:MAG: DUF1847 domain-containing protein [bacterium]
MDKKTQVLPSCAHCDEDTSSRACRVKGGPGAKGCPTHLNKEVLKRAISCYEDPETKEFARQASRQEAECYANRHQSPYIMQPTKPRIVEICEFGKKMGYQRLGLAFCIGLAQEARIVSEILEVHGFEVVSVVCKAGRTPKEIIGIQDEEKIYRNTDESMCNPIYQAMLLNEKKTHMNVLLGLCVGHDSLFFKYAQAPTTVLAVKDRVTGHNPLAAIYLAGSYYRRLKHPQL